MVIGISKEIKAKEYRVASVPEDVAVIVQSGHVVLVEEGAGIGSNFSDEAYMDAGAKIVDKDTLYRESDIIYKVKEFFPEEFHLLRPEQTVFTYLHSNAHPDETNALLEKMVIGIAYEDITDDGIEFPLLAPMSEFAGIGGVFAAIYHMQRTKGGGGLILSAINGLQLPVIVILGAGSSGTAAARVASALGNRVILIDNNPKALKKAALKLPPNVEYWISTKSSINKAIKECDVFMNCVLWPKWRTDHIVTRNMLKLMKPGSLIVDVACDEAGAIETSISTTHDDPVYSEEGIIHYCVDNIPSAYSQSASVALSQATLPFLLQIADKGARKALVDNPTLRRGLTCIDGKLTLEETGIKQNRHYISQEKALGI